MRNPSHNSFPRAAFISRALVITLALTGFAFIGAAVSSSAHATLPETDEEPTDDPDGTDPDGGGGAGSLWCHCADLYSCDPTIHKGCTGDQIAHCCPNPNIGWNGCHLTTPGAPLPPNCF